VTHDLERVAAVADHEREEEVPARDAGDEAEGARGLAPVLDLRERETVVGLWRGQVSGAQAAARVAEGSPASPPGTRTSATAPQR